MLAHCILFRPEFEAGILIASGLGGGSGLHGSDARPIGSGSNGGRLRYGSSLDARWPA